MRRAQIDCGTQPLRNIFTNPAFEGPGLPSQVSRSNLAMFGSTEYSGDFQTLRTNLLTNPSLETVGSTGITWRTNLAPNPGMADGTGTRILKTNLCTNPRGVNAFPVYSTSSQTITANVPITGHPEGITTANRVTYSGVTPNNPGVTLMTGIVAGTTYSLSAWIYFESVQSVPGSTSFTETGVIASPNITPKIGEWQKVTWTRTPTSNTNFGFRTASSDGEGTGSFLITGVVIETAATPSVNFFDGATAPQTNLVKTAAGHTGGITFTDDVAYQGQTWRKASLGATADIQRLIRQQVSLTDLGPGGKTYTTAVTVANPNAEAITVFLDWADVKTTTWTIQPGEIKRISVTAARATYDSTFRFSDLAFMETTAGPRSLLYKDWLIEEGTTNGDYYAASGDYTYDWTGTPNASTSRQKMIGVSQYNTSDKANVGKSLLWKEGGSFSAKVVPNSTSKDTYMEVTGVALETGKTYTISATIRLAEPQVSPESRARKIMIYHSTDVVGTVYSQSTAAPNVAGSTRLSVTFYVTDGTKYQSIRLYNGAGANEGDVWWDNLLIEETDVMRPYFDGSTTPAQDQTHVWSGTAHASTSLLQVSRPSGVSFAGGRFGQLSTEWSARGTKSIKVFHGLLSLSTNADQFVEIQGMLGESLKNNTTYTISATCRTTQVLGGALDARALKPQLNMGGSFITITFSKTKPNTPGISRVVGTFTTPASGTLNFFRLYGGATYGQGDVWWDELVLEEGITDGSYFDGASWGPENLLSNNSFETNTTGWSGAGMTQAVISRVSSQSFSGSACLQVVCDGSVGFQGAFTISNRPSVMPNLPYTASAWIKATAGKRITIECGEIDGANNLINRTQLPYVTATGDWQRLSVTRVMGPTAASSDIVIRNVDATPHTFFVDAVMHTQTDSAPIQDFYSGSGDFSQSWTGTAHQSMSTQKALKIGGWGAANSAKLYQSSVSPVNGSKCAAVATQGFMTDGLYHNDITVVEGNSYTFSSWIKLTSSLPSFSATLRWKDADGVIIKDDILNVYDELTVGSWRRVSATFTAPTGATKLQPMWRIYVSHIPTTFFVDSTLVEAVPAMLSYFDGGFPTESEFNYTWAGLANQSISYQRMTKVAGTSMTYYNAPVMSTEWTASGTASMRLIPNGQKNETFVALFGNFSSTGALEPGKTYTALATLRLAAPLTGVLFPRALSMVYRESQNRKVQVTAQNVAGVQQLRMFFTVSTDATSAFIELFNGAGAGGGDVWWDNILVTEGIYEGDYFDGTKPFCKWEGNAHQSVSVGYAPLLLDIAGVPEFDISEPGTYTLPGGYTSTEARTIYTVYNNFYDILDSQVPTIMTYGSAPLSDTVSNSFITLRQQQAQGSTTNFLLARRTGGNGAGVVNSKIGLNVAAWGLNNSGQIFNSTNNPLAVTTDTVTMNMLHERMYIANPNANSAHVRTLIYRGYHDDAKRQAMFRYLGNKYGFNIT